MLRVFVSLVYAALLSVATACSCAPPPDFPNCDAAIVLYGKALSNNQIECTAAVDESTDGLVVVADPQTLVKFEITTVLKAPQDLDLSAGDVVNVRSYVSGARCGYQMQVGAEYILFPSPQDPPACEEAVKGAVNLATYLCSANIYQPTETQVSQLAEECGTQVPLTPCQESCYARCDRRCGVPY